MLLLAHQGLNRMDWHQLSSTQMDMMTIAEQVECADDAAWLEQAGIDCLQGYYYAAPTVHPPWAPSQMAAQ